MGIEDCFEIEREAREKFIEKTILRTFPEEERVLKGARIRRIVGDYVGCDRDALTILAYAAERGSFEIYAEKLEQEYRGNLSFIHPEARRVKTIPGAQRTVQFFLACYEEMGIHSR